MPLIPCNSVRIGSLGLDGSRTEIAVSLFARDFSCFSRNFRSMLTGSRLFEIRYDLFRNRSSSELEKLLSLLGESGANYIFTFRSDDPDLLSQYYGIAGDHGAPCVDIDISVADQAGRTDRFRTLILSYHSFSGGSVVDRYHDILKKSPDIIKLASSYSGFEDYQSDLLKLQEIKRRDRKCLGFIPMGRANSFLRVMSAYVVSDIVYARAEGETAEGQLTEEEYRSYFSLF